MKTLENLITETVKQLNSTEKTMLYSILMTIPLTRQPHTIHHSFDKPIPSEGDFAPDPFADMH